MSNESSNTQIISNIENQTPQKQDLLQKNASDNINIGQQGSEIIDQVKSKSVNDLNNINEIASVQFLKKKNQSKSKIEIRCSIHPGPISPYTIFLKHMHNLLINANKELTFSQRSVLIANLWAMMSETDKDPFKYSANKINSIS